MMENFVKLVLLLVLLRKGVLRRLVGISLASLLAASSSYATPLTMEWDVRLYGQYNYVTGSYESPLRPTGLVSLTFDNSVSSAIDYGTTTITTFGGLYGGTSWTSPWTSLIGSDPYGTGLSVPYVSYAFPNVSDYVSTFIEQAAWQGNVYSPSGDRFWAYHIELRATRRTSSRGGSGSADYAFTPEALLAFVNGIGGPADEILFNESYQLYDGATRTYLDGYSWSGTATLARVIDASTAVPEPSTPALIFGGVGLLVWTVRRKNRLRPTRR
jgi:hypothetical protein